MGASESQIGPPMECTLPGYGLPALAGAVAQADRLEVTDSLLDNREH